MVTLKQRTILVRTGLFATLAALVVGIGEFTFQFSPRGGYEGTDYLYFLDVSHARLTFGHFLGVLSAPFYVVGYWHISQMFKPAGTWLAYSILGLGTYSFIIGDVWLGGRVNLALIVKAREAAPADSEMLFSSLLADVAAHNEPLINVVRVLILVISLLMAYGILKGKSHYPKWTLAVLPMVLLIAIFGSYAVLPAFGVLLLPAAMNIAHVIFFAASTWVASRLAIS